MSDQSSSDLIEKRARAALNHLDGSDREEVLAWFLDRESAAKAKVRRRDWFGERLTAYGFAGLVIGAVCAVAIAANGCTDTARRRAEIELRECENAVYVLTDTCGISHD